MYTALSQNEREALARFLAKLVEDVDKLASLFESRGVDASPTRTAQEQLKTTLVALQQDPDDDPDDPPPSQDADSYRVSACVPQDL